MKIIVLGAGAWGTALAASASTSQLQAHAVTLWARDAAQLAVLQAQHENQRYLPGVRLPPALTFSAAPLTALNALTADADLVVVATPMAALRPMLTVLASCTAPVAWVCKGFEAPVTGDLGLLGHEIQAQVAPDLQAGV